uniref:Putative cell-cycle-control protein (Translation regulation) n=1 Tax=Toxoplasma gondii TgCATBr9 TaxID=943120 RepID=A0A2T6IT75_TOXGO|nr:putative cell-cycle-control protein (translation regulation) [Toxoplasma gondii TgCATBr9]
MEVVIMLIDCCAMERTFQRFFALQAERLARLNPRYSECLQEAMRRQYHTVHRLETTKLRNTAKFFAHLLHTDAIPWTVMEVFKLTEETTTSSGRIFIKILFQEMSEHLGLRTLNERIHSEDMQPYVVGLFPTDHPRHLRFCINFFTAIGLGGLTDKHRQLLAELQQRAQQEQAKKKLKRETKKKEIKREDKKKETKRETKKKEIKRETKKKEIKREDKKKEIKRKTKKKEIKREDKKIKREEAGNRKRAYERA